MSKKKIASIGNAKAQHKLEQTLLFAERYGRKDVPIRDIFKDLQGFKPSNNIRAAWAASTLESFKLVSHAPALTSNQELLSDLLANLMHLCTKNPDKLWFGEALERAQRNWEAEVTEEG